MPKNLLGRVGISWPIINIPIFTSDHTDLKKSEKHQNCKKHENDGSKQFKFGEIARFIGHISKSNYKNKFFMNSNAAFLKYLRFLLKYAMAIITS